MPPPATAVIAHHGQTMRLGHYTCDVRCTPSAAANATAANATAAAATAAAATAAAATAPDAAAAPTDGADPPAAAAEPPAADKPEWFHCDDSTVHRVPLTEVLRRQAYVLFYERVP